MLFFIFFNVLILVILAFLIYAFSMFWPPDSPWAPWWRTNTKIAKAICRVAKISKKDFIYDLGCGDGELLLIAGKEFGARGIGVEIDLLRFVSATIKILKAGLGKSIKIKMGNFFKEDLSKATIVNVYLVPKTLNKLKPKFFKELKSGTKIVSYRYKMNLEKIAEDKINKIFVYKI
jgi:hypothetical protein